MLYIGYLIILGGPNIKKKSVSESSIFELPRLGNCTSRLCPSPLGSPSPPPLYGVVWCASHKSKHTSAQILISGTIGAFRSSRRSAARTVLRPRYCLVKSM